MNQEAATIVTSVSRDTTANPAPLGLLGFGMTTVLLNLHNAGFYSLDAMILGMGIFYGPGSDTCRHHGMEEREYFWYGCVRIIRFLLVDACRFAGSAAFAVGRSSANGGDGGISDYVGSIHPEPCLLAH